MLSPELQRVLERAAAEAHQRRHPVLTLEHAVYAMAGELTAAVG